MKRQSIRLRSGGQALVIVLLSLAVVLTIVLFILARSTTDIAVSSKNTEATRAFSAAEAGVENALVIGTGGSGTVGNANYSANVSDFAEGQTSFNYPIDLYSGDSMTIWFVSHDSKGNIVPCAGANCFAGPSIKVCWGKSSTVDATTPAIELSVFYETIPGDASTLNIGRTTYDPNGGRVGTNKFNQTFGLNCSLSGATYAFQKSINFADLGVPGASYNNPGGLLFARVRMLYNTVLPQPVGISVVGTNGSVLPSQGTSIDSTGQAGESNRRVNVFEGWPEPPEVFDFAIYSSTGLFK